MMRTEITSGDFQAEVVESEDPVLVVYTADWCDVCKRLMPIFDEVAIRYMEDDIKFCSANVDDSPQLISRNELMVVPTIIAYRKGNRIFTTEGIKTKEELVEIVERHLRKLGS